MSLSILFIIKSDPQSSHRPAEAVRVAVGLGTGKNPLTLVLLNRAPQLLQYEEVDLEDLDTVEKYLPILNEWHVPIYVEASASEVLKPGDIPIKVNPLSENDLARLLSEADKVFVF